MSIGRCDRFGKSNEKKNAHLFACKGQMYEDSIQELNNLIGELDSFQREHEQKMKQKQREKQQQQQQQNQSQSYANGHDVHNTTADTTLTASSIGDMSDIYNNFDKLSIGSSDPNPLMCSTTSEMTFGSDGLNDLTDCQATTMSLKLNLSTTEHPLIMHSSTGSLSGGSVINGNSSMMMNSTSSLNGSTVARTIELIPDSYNVSDDYVKEHTEIVVLRRKDSLNDLTNGSGSIVLEHNQSINGSPSVNGNGKDVERISSFRCSSFAVKNESSSPSDSKSTTLKRGQSISSADSLRYHHQHHNNHHDYGTTNGQTTDTDQDVVDHHSLDNEHSATQMIRQKPIVTPRPASLSGLFLIFFLFIFFFKLISDFQTKTIRFHHSHIIDFFD